MRRSSVQARVLSSYGFTALSSSAPLPSASSLLAGCQTSQDAARPSLESVQISKCGHIPDNRPNAVKRRDCFNEAMISYRTEHEFPDMDIAQEVALNYKLAAIDYRDGRIGREQYDVRVQQARVAATRQQANRADALLQAMSASQPTYRPSNVPAPQYPFSEFRTPYRNRVETVCRRKFGEVRCTTE
jgi:hypothetical protein